MARGFLTYLRATLPETEVPDSALVASFRRPKPYLFTPDQIRTLIQDAKKARPQRALRPHTFSTLIGLLASTGLRGGEALRLMVTDVWLESEPPCLHLRETKFYKSRLSHSHPRPGGVPSPPSRYPHGFGQSEFLARLVNSLSAATRRRDAAV